MAAVQWWGRVAAKPAWSGAWFRQQQIPTIWSVRHKAVSAFCSWLEPDACCSTDFGLHCLKQEMVRSFSKVTGVMLFLPNSEMQHDWNRQLAHSNCSDCASSFQVNATWTLLCTQCRRHARPEILGSICDPQVGIGVCCSMCIQHVMLLGVYVCVNEF